MFYQWGRKDPFPATKAKEEEQDGGGEFTVIATSSSTGTIEYAIKNPNVFITASDDPKDWLSTPDGTLWGNAGAKSVYDPCPAGWRVPKNSNSSMANSPWTGFGDAFNQPTNTDGPFSNGHSWGTNAVYPAAGNRNQGTGAVGSPSTGGNYWSAAPSGTSASFLCFSDSNVFVADSFFRASGFSVRCVRE